MKRQKDDALISHFGECLSLKSHRAMKRRIKLSKKRRKKQEV